jgi:hypothetical protein
MADILLCVSICVSILSLCYSYNFSFIFIAFIDPENIVLDTWRLSLYVLISEDIGKIDLSRIEAAAILLVVSILSQCLISDVAIYYYIYNFNFIFIWFLDPENMVLATKIVLLCALEVKILGKFDLSSIGMAAILFFVSKKDGRHKLDNWK